MFHPKSEEELKRAMVFDKGEYDFEVVEADITLSRKGNPMLALKLKVFGQDGRSCQVRDWLVASDEALPLMKLRHYCRAVGALEAYESGDLNNFPGVGACGRCKLRIEEDEKYGAQNRVADYLEPKASQPAPRQTVPAKAAPETVPPVSPAADDIPF